MHVGFHMVHAAVNSGCIVAILALQIFTLLHSYYIAVLRIVYVEL